MYKYEDEDLTEEDLREDGVVKGEAKPVLYTAGLGLLCILIAGTVEVLIRLL